MRNIITQKGYNFSVSRKINSLWIITNGNRGNVVNCDGVAAYLDADTIRHVTVERTPLNALFAPYWPAVYLAGSDEQIVPPWPDMVIASSRLAAPYARYIRKASQGKSFCAFLQDPICASHHFDFVWAPQHDKLSGANVLSTALSPHQITLDRLAKTGAALALHLPSTTKPRLAVIIGGPNSAYNFTAREADSLVQALVQLADRYALLLTVSRRTPSDLVAQLKRTIAPVADLFFDGQGDNPYPGILALSDAILVTSDSVNMTGEACAAGVPVYVLHLPARRASKFDRFHAELENTGMTRRFTGTIDLFPSAPHDDTPAIAAALLRRYNAHPSS